MTEYQKREIVGALPSGANVIGSVNEARGKTILYDGDDVTNGTTTMRTVTAGKTYYLLMAGLAFYSSANGEEARIRIGGGTNFILRLASRITPTYRTTDSDHSEVTFPHPIPVAAGVAISVTSTAAVLGAYGWIVGWEE